MDGWMEQSGEANRAPWLVLGLDGVSYTEEKDKHTHEVTVGGRLNSIRTVNGKKNITESTK